MMTVNQINETETDNYYKEIESHFCARRGAFRILSPRDWSLMESWKHHEIPLHVVLRGIDLVFEKLCERERGTINTLSYCKSSVLNESYMYRKGQLGIHVPQPSEQKSELLKILYDLRLKFQDVHFPLETDDNKIALKDFCTAIANQLYVLIENPHLADFEAIQTKFDLQNKRLAELARCCVSAETLADWCAEILTDSRIAKIPEDVKQQTLDALIDKRAIEHFELPQLSL